MTAAAWGIVLTAATVFVAVIATLQTSRSNMREQRQQDITGAVADYVRQIARLEKRNDYLQQRNDTLEDELRRHR